MNNRSRTERLCIHCGRCTRNCSFLSKYDINLAGFASRPDLALHCFLCGRCKQECPVDLDGRLVAMEHRIEDPHDFRMLKFMKSPYKLRNNSSQKTDDLIFFGCNFLGYYPRTTMQMIDALCNETVGFSVDCCGKPVYETGDRSASQTNKEHLNRLLRKKQVKRLITACPNCYYYLKDKLKVPVVSIYAYLKERGIGMPIKEQAHIFAPCPDKETWELLSDLRFFVSDTKLSPSRTNCCGMGGLASRKEPELVEGYLNELRALDVPNLYTYCATCSGQFQKHGLTNVKHIVSEILGVHEEVDLSFAKNVIRAKFIPHSHHR